MLRSRKRQLYLARNFVAIIKIRSTWVMILAAVNASIERFVYTYMRNIVKFKIYLRYAKHYYHTFSQSN